MNHIRKYIFINDVKSIKIFGSDFELANLSTDNNKHKAVRWAPEEGLNNQWGPEFPPEFLDDPHVHAM